MAAVAQPCWQRRRNLCCPPSSWAGAARCCRPLPPRPWWPWIARPHPPRAAWAAGPRARRRCPRRGLRWQVRCPEWGMEGGVHVPHCRLPPPSSSSSNPTHPPHPPSPSPPPTQNVGHASMTLHQAADAASRQCSLSPTAAALMRQASHASSASAILRSVSLQASHAGRGGGLPAQGRCNARTGAAANTGEPPVPWGGCVQSAHSKQVLEDLGAGEESYSPHGSEGGWVWVCVGG